MGGVTGPVQHPALAAAVRAARSAGEIALRYYREGFDVSVKPDRTVVTQADRDASLAALPDTFAGHRLAGTSKDRASMRHTLSAIGLNPLVVRAFRDRTAAPTTPAWHDGFHSSR